MIEHRSECLEFYSVLKGVKGKHFFFFNLSLFQSHKTEREGVREIEKL